MIALVTGANRGIGLEVVRQLVRKGVTAIIGARRREAGEKALASFGEDHKNVLLTEIDVADAVSVKKAAQLLARRLDVLDILVNNAAVLLDEDTPVTELSAETFSQTVLTNTWGALQVTQALLPLLQKSTRPRVINVSSGAGSLSEMASYAPAYSISKAALNAVTRQLAAALPGIAVNSVDPGWVRTDMGGANAPRSVEQGADSIVWLATEAPQRLTGQFIHDRKPAAW